MKKLLPAFVLVAMLPFLNASSCSSSDRSDNYDDRYDNRAPDRYGPGPDAPPPGYYGDDRYGLPENAARVAEGKGNRLVFVPNATGDYFVYYSKDRAIIKSGRLFDGDRLIVDPDKNRIYVEGKTVFDSDLKSDRVYRIYFARADGRQYRGPGGHVEGSGGRREEDRYGSGNSGGARQEGDRGNTRPPEGTGSKVPKGAELVASGGGRREMTPKFDGAYYVYDDKYDVVIVEGKIGKGQRLLVDPEAGKVTLRRADGAGSGGAAG